MRQYIRYSKSTMRCLKWPLKSHLCQQCWVWLVLEWESLLFLKQSCKPNYHRLKCAHYTRFQQKSNYMPSLDERHRQLRKIFYVFFEKMCNFTGVIVNLRRYHLVSEYDNGFCHSCDRTFFLPNTQYFMAFW